MDDTPEHDGILTYETTHTPMPSRKGSETPDKRSCLYDDMNDIPVLSKKSTRSEKSLEEIYQHHESCCFCAIF